MDKEQLLKGLRRKKEDLTNEHNRLERALQEDIKDGDYSHMAKIASELKSVCDRVGLLREIIEDIEAE